MTHHFFSTPVARMKTLKNSLLRGRQKRGSVASISSTSSVASTFSTASTIPEIAVPTSQSSSSSLVTSPSSSSVSAQKASAALAAPSPASPSPKISRTSPEPGSGSDGGLRNRSTQPTRMVNVEGWLELRYGESTNKKEILEKLVNSPVKDFQRRYWFQLMGGFLTWFPQEDHHFSQHAHLGRIDLKNDVVEIRDIAYDAATKLYRITLITEEAVHRKELEELEVEGKTIAKTSIRNLVERCEYLLCTSDELAMYRWRDALNRAVKRRSGAVSPTAIGNRNSSPAASPTPIGGRTSLDAPRSSFLTRSNSLTPQPIVARAAAQAAVASSSSTIPHSASAPASVGAPRMTHSPSIPASLSSPSSPSASLASSSSPIITENKGRLVKQQGFLELETKVEASGEVISLTKATYWLELLGGYLVWYERQNHTGQPLGRIQVKAGDSVGELIQKEVGGKRVASFTFATTEEIHRREEQVKDGQEQLFIKTTMKKEKTTYTLSSHDFTQVNEWRAQVSAMARRKIVSAK